MTVKVKICGITRLEDALGALEAGADALGFIFHEPSPRFLTVAAAWQIIRRLPPFVSKVGVFVNATEASVDRAVSECGLDTLQFHGDEPPEFCQGFSPAKIIKAFRIRSADSLSALTSYATDAWLLDGYFPGKPGGAGARFNWDLAVRAKTLGRPIILAGGLTPDNVAEAVRQVQPYSVDVSSGVESTPGRKDPAKVRSFLAAAKGAALP